MTLDHDEAEEQEEEKLRFYKIIPNENGEELISRIGINCNFQGFITYAASKEEARRNIRDSGYRGLETTDPKNGDKNFWQKSDYSVCVEFDEYDEDDHIDGVYDGFSLVSLPRILGIRFP